MHLYQTLPSHCPNPLSLYTPTWLLGPCVRAQLAGLWVTDSHIPDKCCLSSLCFLFAPNESGWHCSLCLVICFYFPKDCHLEFSAHSYVMFVEDPRTLMKLVFHLSSFISVSYLYFYFVGDILPSELSKFYALLLFIFLPFFHGPCLNILMLQHLIKPNNIFFIVWFQFWIFHYFFFSGAGRKVQM